MSQLFIPEYKKNKFLNGINKLITVCRRIHAKHAYTTTEI